MSRQKGLIWVREVKAILEDLGHIVERPQFRPVWLKTKSILVHVDFFGIADLISYWNGMFYLHQVTDLPNKARHVKVINEKKIPCRIWCRVGNGKVHYRTFEVGVYGDVLEGGIYELKK